MGEKKAQMKLSFGMIFSIILIVFFLVFAFFAIKMFLGTNEKAVLSKFVDGLQTDITTIWKSPQGSQQISYRLPKNIEEVCIADDVNENLRFYPEKSEDLPPIVLEHLDVYNTTHSLGSVPDKPGLGNNVRHLCFNKEDGEIEIVLEKNFGEALVRVVKETV
ncbi:MAG: hypothetical protein KKB31_01290 [Nanoarchaeota archaeon]|nr:hypothetical protein [Nanoarchaeota archaeon]